MLKQIEKRVKKDIRLNNPFSKGEKILVIDNGTKKAFLTIYLLKKITQGLDLKITIKKQEILKFELNPSYDKTILPLDADDFIDEFVKEIGENKKKPAQTVISLLRTVLDKEVLQSNLELNQKSQKTVHILDKLEQKYPGSKFAFLKSLKFIKHLK